MALSGPMEIEWTYAIRSEICWSFIGPPPAIPHAGIGLEVWTPVRRQLDLGTGLSGPVGGGEDVDEPRHDRHDGDRESDLLLSRDCEDQESARRRLAVAVRAFSVLSRRVGADGRADDDR